MSHIEYKFESKIAEMIIKKIPRVRGASMIGSFLMNFLPIKRKVTMKFHNVECYLNLANRTQFGFLLNLPEQAESQAIAKMLSEGDIFVDIGANWGYYSILAGAIVGEEGLVVSLEANPKTFSHLVDTIKDSGLNNVLAFNYAVSDKEGDKVVLNLPWYRNDTAGFIIKIKPFGRNYVRTKKIDTLWRQIGKPQVKGVKIDVEGAEALVILGGEKFFHKGVTDFVMVEISSWSKKRYGYEPVYIDC